MTLQHPEHIDSFKNSVTLLDTGYSMEDKEIVDLYWARSETAISETKTKYEPYLMTIARNVLDSISDSEESVSDTYLRAWNAMPSDRPMHLASYLGKITRNISIDRYRQAHALKRGSGEYDSSLDELQECLAAEESVEHTLAAKELGQKISAFLNTRDYTKRVLFVSRYFYMDSIADIAEKANMKEVTVRSILSRERAALKNYLEKEGYIL